MESDNKNGEFVNDYNENTNDKNKDDEYVDDSENTNDRCENKNENDKKESKKFYNIFNWSPMHKVISTTSIILASIFGVLLYRSYRNIKDTR